MTKTKRRNVIFNLLRHAILLLVLYILQGLVFPWLRFNAVPLLLCVAVSGIAHFEGTVNGGIFGLFGGILMDLSLGKPLIVFTLVLTVMGLIIGILGESLFTRRLISYIFSALMVLVVAAFLQMFPLLFFGDVPLGHLLLTALMQTITSLICAVLMYPIIKSISHKSRR